MKRIAARSKLAPCGALAAAMGAAGCAGVLDLDVHYVDGASDGSVGVAPSTDAEGNPSDARTDGSAIVGAPRDASGEADAAEMTDVADAADATAETDAVHGSDAAGGADAADGPDVTDVADAEDAADLADAADTADVVAMADGTADADEASIDAQPPDASHVIAYVQGTASQATTALTSSVTVAFPYPVTAGDTLVVAADYDTADSNYAGIQITDTLDSQFVLAVGPIDNGYPNFIYYALDVQGGIDTLTLTLTEPSPSFIEFYIHEYSGIAALDVAAGATGTTTVMSSGTAVTTAPG
ncbi:MAG: hypothetical protein FWD17_19850, partial [Polyangiaceae bacterium]|nr:hypothetical protein [Polyangiaceae bacterium]